MSDESIGFCPRCQKSTFDDDGCLCLRCETCHSFLEDDEAFFFTEDIFGNTTSYCQTHYEERIKDD